MVFNIVYSFGHAHFQSLASKVIIASAHAALEELIRVHVCVG